MSYTYPVAPELSEISRQLSPQAAMRQHPIRIYPLVHSLGKFRRASTRGKNKRRMVRYWGDKKRPSVAFCMQLTDAHRIEIKRSKLEIGAGDTIMLGRPEHRLRLTGLLNDALAFSKNDDNFKRGASASAAS